MSVNLIEFQSNLLSKIAARTTQANDTRLQWLGFTIGGNYYLVSLNRIKEVLPPPEKYLNFCGWVHEGVKGGLQHKDEIWTVFKGVRCFSEHAHIKGEMWDFRLLLLKQNEMGGNIAVAVDKIIGLMSDEEFEKFQQEENDFGILSKVKIKNDETFLDIWDPLVWKNEPRIMSVVYTN